MSDFRFERLQPHHYEDLAEISKNAFNINTSYDYYLNKNYQIGYFVKKSQKMIFLTSIDNDNIYNILLNNILILKYY